MTSNLLTNPQYWRDRAEEIQAIAERSVHDETKRMLEKTVPDYEFYLPGDAKGKAQAAPTVRLNVPMCRKHEIGVAVSDIERAARLSPVHCYSVNRNGPDPSHPCTPSVMSPASKNLSEKRRNYEKGLMGVKGSS